MQENAGCPGCYNASVSSAWCSVCLWGEIVFSQIFWNLPSHFFSFFIISSQGYCFFLISGSWVQWLKLTKEIALQILWFFDCAQKFTGEGLPNELPCQQLKFEAGEKGCLISLGFLQASLLTLLSTHSLEMGVISKTSIVFSMWKSFSAGLLGLPGFCSRPCTNGRSHMWMSLQTSAASHVEQEKMRKSGIIALGSVIWNPKMNLLDAEENWSVFV